MYSSTYKLYTLINSNAGAYYMYTALDQVLAQVHRATGVVDTIQNLGAWRSTDLVLRNCGSFPRLRLRDASSRVHSTLLLTSYQHLYIVQLNSSHSRATYTHTHIDTHIHARTYTCTRAQALIRWQDCASIPNRGHAKFLNSRGSSNREVIRIFVK